jgi:hypothetical protein
VARLPEFPPPTFGSATGEGRKRRYEEVTRLNPFVPALFCASLIVVAGLAVASASAGPTPPPPKGYKLQQSILVPLMNAGGVKTQEPLAAGKVYVLRVTGTFYEGAGFYGRGYGDAEYGFYKSGQVIDKCRNGVDLGVGINDTTVLPGHVKALHWGTYHANHVYSRPFTGTGIPIQVDYHDCAYPDNRPAVQWPGTGRVMLWIYAPIS